MEISEIVHLLDQVFDELPKPVSDCISLYSDGKVFLIDPPTKAKDQPLEVHTSVPTTDVHLTFTILNPNKKIVAVWDSDGCTTWEVLTAESRKKRCDAIVFSDLELAFVELKLNAQNSSEYSIKKNRKKGLEQLHTTMTRVFDDFSTARIQRPWRHYEAILATPSLRYPDKGTFSAVESAKFAERGVMLSERRVMRFN